MTTPASSIPVSVDYTRRDYYTLREALILRIQDRLPEWTASDPADFGVALVEAFSYMGDVISYYIDRAANETFIATATQRQSILNIAQNYGYIPAGYRQSTVEITFFNSSTTSLTLPAGTVVSGDVVSGDTVQTVYFTTVAETIIPARVGAVNGQNTVIANEGRSVVVAVPENSNEYGELIGTSEGTPNQIFELGETPVVDGSIEIYVQDGDVYSKWTQVQHILDYGALDLVYTIYLDENDVVTVYFGDGVSGAIPVSFSEIRAIYTVGGGLIGNIPTNTLTNIEYLPGLSEGETAAIQSAVTLSNTVAIGGSDPESNDQIRVAAPASLRSGNRAVTLKDFSDLALSVAGVGKANAQSNVWTSVNLYISPSRNVNDSDVAPGLDSLGNPTTEYDRIKADVETYLEDKVLLGTTVTVLPPVYVDLDIAFWYTKLPQYTTSQIQTALKKQLLTSFGYTGMSFQDTIYPQDIEFVLQQVFGVKTLRVTKLCLHGGSGLNDLEGDADEIFRFSEANITISEI